MTNKQTFARVVWCECVKALETLNMSVRTPKPFGLFYS